MVIAISAGIATVGGTERRRHPASRGALASRERAEAVSRQQRLSALAPRVPAIMYRKSESVTGGDDQNCEHAAWSLLSAAQSSATRNRGVISRSGIGSIDLFGRMLSALSGITAVRMARSREKMARYEVLD
jgi:hypothetical protein